MIRILLLFLLSLITGSIQAQFEKKADSLIDLMSTEEKIYMVTGTGMDIPGVTEDSEPVQASVGVTKDKVPGAAGTSFSIDRLNIPTVVFADGPAGIRIAPTREDVPGETYYATAFPTATSISSSWNTELAREVGKAFGIEGKAYGIDFLLAPALNIHRNPLGGRNFEYYSEDPLLSGTTAGHFVKGVQSQGIGATLKHFAANNSETNRMALNTVVSERALREIYLKGFEIAMAIEEPWALMSSYNKINGTYASENAALLTDLLRTEWGFKGFVMTDWFAGKDAVAQMQAGNDLLMPGTIQQRKAIREALKNGALKEEVLNRNIGYILQQYFKTPSFKGNTITNNPPLEKHKQIARQAASEGMVLLKNENTLPVRENTKVALLGNTSYATISGGTGSGDVNKAYMVSIKEGMEAAGLTIDSQLAQTYSAYIKREEERQPPKEFWFAPDRLLPEMPLTQQEIAQIAENNDIGIYTLGRTSGEFQDRIKEGDYLLTQQEKELIAGLSAAFQSRSKQLLVVLNIGGVIETQSWKAGPDAILLAWQPGQEAGHAIADIITGKVTPSGKLPVTFPLTLEDIPSTQNFPGSLLDPNAPKPENPLMAQDSKEVYEEDIYIGYRYFNTFKKEVSYPFGFGLSYTTFSYDKVDLGRSDEEITIEMEVTNTGTHPGKDVIQVYVQSPKTQIERPRKELKAYAKTQTLAPGATQTMSFKVKINDLGYYDEEQDSWILADGQYTLFISTDINTVIQAGTVKLQGRTIENTKDLLAPKQTINTLKQY